MLTAPQRYKRSAVRQNKLPRARIVIKIRVAVPGSNKWKQTLCCACPALLPKRSAFKLRPGRLFPRRSRPGSFPSQRIANYWRWWKCALRILHPPPPPPPLFYPTQQQQGWTRFYVLSCPLKNRRGSLTGAGLFPPLVSAEYIFSGRACERRNNHIINAYLFLFSRITTR